MFDIDWGLDAPLAPAKAVESKPADRPEFVPGLLRYRDRRKFRTDRDGLRRHALLNLAQHMKEDPG